MFCIFSIKLRKQKLHKYLSCSLVSDETSKLTRLIWPKINPVKAIVFAMKEGCTVNTQRCNIFFCLLSLGYSIPGYLRKLANL